MVCRSDVRNGTKFVGLFGYQKNTGRGCSTNPDLKDYASTHLTPFMLLDSYSRRLHLHEDVYACSDTFCRVLLGRDGDRHLEE